MSALEIQWEYLSRAKDFTEKDGIDPITLRVIEMSERALSHNGRQQILRQDRPRDRLGDQVPAHRAVRAKHDLPLSAPRIAQLDLAYHDVHHGRGLYYLLQRNGAVDRVTSNLKIFEAKSIPPQTTRAKLRGEFMRHAQEKERNYAVDWVHLKLNNKAQRTVVCKDPFRSVPTSA